MQLVQSILLFDSKSSGPMYLFNQRYGKIEINEIYKKLLQAGLA